MLSQVLTLQGLALPTPHPPKASPLAPPLLVPVSYSASIVQVSRSYTCHCSQTGCSGGQSWCLFVCHAEEILHKITSIKEYGTEFCSAKSELECFEGTASTVLIGGPPPAH